MPTPEPFGGPFGPTGSLPPTPTIANVWSKASDGYIYGSSQLQITNTTGNWLFAIAQWNVTEDAGTLVWVADDAHNFWQPVSVVTSSTSSVRTAILVVQDALATPTGAGNTYPGFTTVTFSSSGFLRNPIFTVIEVGGLQPGYTLDFTPVQSAIFATSITLSATAPSADFILAAATTRQAANPITISGGWTSIAQKSSNAVNTPPGNPVLGASAYQFTSSSTTPSITFTASNTAWWSGVLIGVQTNGGLPVNPYNANWPLIQCQAAFGVTPGSQSSYYTWTDITSRFLGIRGDRGKDHELDQLEASDMIIELDNHDGALNPFNTASPYYPNVKLITPIRVLMTWQGRTYQFFNGHFEYLPQAYEQQYGIVNAQSSDDYAKLPQIQLQDAITQEVQYDSPWGHWPLADPQGATLASNISGKSITSMDIVNFRTTSGQPNAFGVAGGAGNFPAALQGSQGTVWQTTGHGNTNPSVGTGLRVLDYSMPAITANGYGIETWFMPLTDTLASFGQTILALEDNNARKIGGEMIYVTYGTAPGNSLGLHWVDSTGTIQSGFPTGTYPVNQWVHIFLALTPTTWNLYVNGVSNVSGTWTPPSLTPNILELNGVSNRFAKSIVQTNANFLQGNGEWSHAALYAQTIDAERILAHYNSGATGFATEDTGLRAQRLLTYTDWAKPQAIDNGISLTQRLNYLGTGAGANTLGSNFQQIGSIGQPGNSGTQADQALQDQALTENGLIFVDRNGTFIFHNRDNLYNGGVRGTFGDSFIPLNKNGIFINTSPWTGINGATISQGSATWNFIPGAGSLLFTGNGTTFNPGTVSENTIPVQAATSYTFNTWAMSPQGWDGVQLTITWFNSSNTQIGTSSSQSFNLPPKTPLPISVTATSPASSAFAQLTVQMIGQPASSVQTIIDRTWLSATGYQAAYLDDVIINYDVTILYNDITVTRNIDGAFIRVIDTASRNQYFPRVLTRTIYDNNTNPPQDLIDNANWLLNAYKQPSFRIEEMNVDVASQPDAWDIALRVDVGDVVGFTRQAPGTQAITKFFIVLKISPQITQDTAKMTYSLGPILNAVLTLDDPAAGLLGPNVLGF